MNIGEESEAIEVPMPVHPDEIPDGTPALEPVTGIPVSCLQAFAGVLPLFRYKRP